jgi:hypothetical protein
MLPTCSHGKHKEEEKKLNQKEHKCKIKLPKKVSLDDVLRVINAEANKGYYTS